MRNRITKMPERQNLWSITGKKAMLAIDITSWITAVWCVSFCCCKCVFCFFFFFHKYYTFYGIIMLSCSGNLLVFMQFWPNMLFLVCSLSLWKYTFSCQRPVRWILSYTAWLKQGTHNPSWHQTRVLCFHNDSTTRNSVKLKHTHLFLSVCQHVRSG